MDSGMSPRVAPRIVTEAGATNETRVDRWLSAVRLVKTRPMATKLCEGGHVEVAADLLYDLRGSGVATHGRRGFAHFWMGSVAEQVVRGAHCPVIVLRTEQQA